MPLPRTARFGSEIYLGTQKAPRFTVAEWIERSGTSQARTRSHLITNGQ